MNRRAFLLGVTVPATGSVAGCTSRLPGRTPPPDAFEQCETLTVGLEQLPDPAQTEVETAYETDRYETDDELYVPHVIDIETTHIERDAGYFLQAAVESVNGTNRLTVSRTTPNWGERSLELRNDTDDPHAVDLRVVRLPNWQDDEEVVVETTVEIDGDETVPVGEFDRAFGEYSAEATINGSTSQNTWDERASKGALRELVISRRDGDIEVLPGAQPHVHADGFDCEWDPN